VAAEPISTSSGPSEVADYGAIAHEYYDKSAHPTCHNFLQLSRAYIGEQIAAVAGQGRILEVGAGESAAAALLHARGGDLSRLEITDASAAMLAHSVRYEALGASLLVADATALPYQDAVIDCVIGSLVDPYNTPALWQSLARVLKPYGRAIVTLPSYAWASRFRAGGDRAALSSAEFVLRNGAHVRVRSLIPPLAQQIRMIEQAGFEISEFRSLGANGLSAEDLSPKVRVFDGPFSSLVWGFTAIRLPTHAPHARAPRS
jgi:SAM-dependent methyltransferase